MQTAIILMTILGCDDALTACDYVASPRERWVSVELCHAASERLLDGYVNVPYPTVIAVCQEPEAPASEIAGNSTDTTPEPPQVAEPEPEERKGLAARALDTVRLAIPGREKVRMVFATPLHVIADSYSWVARKVTN